MDIEYFKERFWSKVEIKSDDECWEWLGCKIGGYGMMKVHSKPLKSHRLSWILENGEIPSGLYVCHHCDNKGCVNNFISTTLC